MLAELFVADICQDIPAISNESVDYIITDPPYGKKYLPLWFALGQAATHKLKWGGTLLAMSGQTYLPSVLQALVQAGLTYRWTIANYMSRAGGEYYSFGANVLSHWKPIIWFMKVHERKEILTEACGDVIYSDKVTKKTLHKWQQNLKVFQELVNYHTHPGDVIWDPFVGSGTTLVACRNVGNRNVIGTDLSEDCIHTTQSRLQQVKGLEGWFKA